MKYTYDQIHQLCTFAYLKARESERSTLAALDFEVDVESKLKDLATELYTRRWSPSPLDWFVTLDPTVREVFAPKFRDRVVSHVLFSMISPIFERYFVFDSHSCRVGKGTLEGIARFEHNLRSVTDNYRHDAWVLNLDISGYFMSIIRERLYGIIWEVLNKHRKRFPEVIDYEFADYIISAYLFRDPLKDCRLIGNPALCKLVQPNKSMHNRAPGLGLPIGDVINQLNSNIYLNPFDQFVKRVLHIRGYNRYVDDSRLIHRDYNYLLECKDRCGEFLHEKLCLLLHPNKTTITNAYDTNYFLGAAIKPHRRYAKDAALRRFKHFVEDVEKKLKSGEEVDMKPILDSFNSRLGYLRHFDEWKMTKKIVTSAPTIMETFVFTAGLTKVKIKPTES